MRPLIACILLAGCGLGESRLNPVNWFGDSVEEAPASLLPAEAAEREDDRPLVAEVTQLRVNQTPDGAIVEAVGRAPGAGAWNPELVARPADGSVLTLDFRARPLRGAAEGGGGDLIVAGTFLTARELAGVTTIRVTGESNARTARR